MSHQRRILGGAPPQHEGHLALRQQPDHRGGLQPRLAINLRAWEVDGAWVRVDKEPGSHVDRKILSRSLVIGSQICKITGAADDGRDAADDVASTGTLRGG